MKQFLKEIEKTKDIIYTNKNSFYKDLSSFSKKLDDEIKNNQNNLSDLKDKLDIIIDKTSKINQDISNKKTQLSQEQVYYETAKNQFQKKNDKFLQDISLLKTGHDINTFKKFNGNISGLTSSLNTRNTLITNILKTKEKYKKMESELDNYEKITNDSLLDKKLLEAINSNLMNNFQEIKSGLLNTTISVTNLKKTTNDRDNYKKLEFEKNQQNELYHETNNKIKKLLTEHEVIQNEIKELTKKKHKLKENLNTKELETNFKIGNLKSEIANLNKQIANVNSDILHNVQMQKEFILDNELRLKNLLLILNNLLLKIKSSNRNPNTHSDIDGLLKNILFDSNQAIDINLEVNDSVIEEINKTILNKK